MKLIFLIIPFIQLMSCIRADIPVKPMDRGDLQVVTIPMTPDYTDQFYFSFSKNEIVSRNNHTIWDLAFQGYGEDYYIILNGAKFMDAADMGNVDFDSVKDRFSAEFKYDSTNGQFENYSIGKWWVESDGKIISKNHIYIINRGKDATGRRYGFFKLQILEADSVSYRIKYANLDGSNENIMIINRNIIYNYSMFSFSDGGKQLLIEPPRLEWDILFTKFIAFLPYENSLLPYGVTGVISNHTTISAAVDSISNFDEINLAKSEDYLYLSEPGYIGYQWKNFEINGEIYSAKLYMNYILKDYNGFLWKFRFIDFYNDEGIRGYPKFELKKL